MVKIARRGRESRDERVQDRTTATKEEMVKVSQLLNLHNLHTRSYLCSYL
jgi:hypothetical protein